MSIVLKMLQLIIKQISPELRELIVASLRTWKEKAATTKNPWDDIVADLLLFMLGEK